MLQSKDMNLNVRTRLIFQVIQVTVDYFLCMVFAYIIIKTGEYQCVICFCLKQMEKAESRASSFKYSYDEASYTGSGMTDDFRLIGKLNNL